MIVPMLLDSLRVQTSGIYHCKYVPGLLSKPRWKGLGDGKKKKVICFRSDFPG